MIINLCCPLHVHKEDNICNSSGRNCTTLQTDQLLPQIYYIRPQELTHKLGMLNDDQNLIPKFVYRSRFYEHSNRLSFQTLQVWRANVISWRRLRPKYIIA